jgi:hypothetical protein
LQQLLVVVLGTSILFGLSFHIYNGGFSPSDEWVTAIQGEDVPAGERDWGKISTYGIPFHNMEKFTSWQSRDTTNSSARRHIRYSYSGMAFNLIFWFLFSCALQLLWGFLLNSREANTL